LIEVVTIEDITLRKRAIEVKMHQGTVKVFPIWKSFLERALLRKLSELFLDNKCWGQAMRLAPTFIIYPAF
jgi:hypothetical protein